MLSKEDLDARASLKFETAGAHLDGGRIDWSDAENFDSLREAMHWAMTAEPPPGKEPYIRTASGRVLDPDMLEQVWVSVQGP
ncbi:hypothetical protein [Microvirga sp. 2TAF3]|uniref:hypothetical protein n=1 Tax=Microvirga sp. 2TAF3 TaxID=3233014 RepID=UPI003F98A1AC